MLEPLISVGPQTVFFELSIVIFLGLVLGSFSTALIYRVPRQIPWAVKTGKKENENSQDAKQPSAHRSACPQCLHPLGVLDLVPVLSWVFLKGRCRHCKVQIPPTYPCAELLSLLAILGLYMSMDLTLLSLLYIALVPLIIALMFIDLAHMILPNKLVGLAAALGTLRLLALLVLEPEMLEILLMDYLGGAILYGAVAWFVGFIIEKMLKKESLGFGDVKFFAMAGLWLGIDWLSYFMILSGVLGVAIALIWRVVKKQDVFPFGPALIISFYILMLLGGSNFY